MARILYIETAHRDVGGNANHTGDNSGQEGSGCDTSYGVELCCRPQLVHAAQEGSQVIQRPPQSFPHDRAPDAARPGKTVQRVWPRA
jgi:hypothetical protein